MLMLQNDNNNNYSVCTSAPNKCRFFYANIVLLSLPHAVTGCCWRVKFLPAGLTLTRAALSQPPAAVSRRSITSYNTVVYGRWQATMTWHFISE